VTLPARSGPVFGRQLFRFVIDLNRPSDDKPLYTTATTGLYPDTLFDGRDTFKPGMAPTDARRQDYLAQIWQPYHERLQSELARIKQQFGYALLFDAHSLRRSSRGCLTGSYPI
jgi:formiminoglutamase